MRSKVITPIRITLVMIAWFFCCFEYYREFDHPPFINIGMVLLLFIAGIISVLSSVFDYKTYTRHKKITAFIPTLIALICIAGYFGVREYLLRKDRTPVVLRASSHSGFNTFSIDFRENGTYKCGWDYFMGGADYERGDYSIKDSTIYLDRKNLDRLLKSDKLLIKTMMVKKRREEKKLLKFLFSQPKYDTIPETFLFQLNRYGDTIPKAVKLRYYNVKEN